MPVPQLRQKLHEIIETAELQRLEAIYSLLEVDADSEADYTLEDI